MLAYRPNVPAAPAVYACPGCTLFASVNAAFGSAFGNLERNSIHGPSTKQVDLFFSKHFRTGGRTDIEFRTEVFNLFDTANFANPVGTLPQAIPNAALTEANRVQPGQPYTAAAAGTFGRLTSTVGRTVGLGTPRQVQFAFRFSF